MRTLVLIALSIAACGPTDKHSDSGTKLTPMESWEETLHDAWLSTSGTSEGTHWEEVWNLCEDEDASFSWIRWTYDNDSGHPSSERLTGTIELHQATTHGVEIHGQGEHRSRSGQRTLDVTKSQHLHQEEDGSLHLDDQATETHIYPCPIDLPD